MKRRVYFFRFIILTIFFLFVNSSIVFAEETGTEGILESQKNSLNISGLSLIHQILLTKMKKHLKN